MKKNREVIVEVTIKKQMVFLPQELELELFALFYSELYNRNYY
jgi:hypothetical protein